SPLPVVRARLRANLAFATTLAPGGGGVCLPPAIMATPTCTAAPTMAKGHPLQEQLLKAGLVKKSKVSAVAREQHVARHARAAAGPNEIELEAQRLRAEKVERDRALEAGRRAQVRQRELQAQARQIIHDKRVPHGGESEYRFNAA